MTTLDGSGSGSTTQALLDELLEDVKKLKTVPPYMRAGLAAAAAEAVVLVLLDLDRRIQQLESVERDQQDNRHGDLPAV